MGTQCDMSMEEVNRLLRQSLAETHRLVIRLCHALPAGNVDNQPVRRHLALLCGEFSRTRGLIGRAFLLAEVPDPCCYPGDLNGVTGCGVPYGIATGRGRGTRRLGGPDHGA